MNNLFPPRPFCDKVARILSMYSGRVPTEERVNEKPTLLAGVFLLLITTVANTVQAGTQAGASRAPIIVSN